MIISLDIETTGLDPNRHQILSIGACTLDGGIQFYREVIHEEVTLTMGAMRVNKLVPWEFQKGDSWHNIQRDLIETFKIVDGDKLLGWNVGSFDRIFLKKIWEGLFPFHYRSVDLNSICEFLGKDAKGFKKLGMDKLGHIGLNLHHALYDALLAAKVYELLKKDSVRE